ncbi:MAG: glycosyltransferase family 39 protein [Anaerolineae bacterium]|nr:glycosyltransferase family 39 protein [Anaerolineae bacterium]
MPARLRSSRFQLPLLLAITLLAAFLRLYKLDSLPPGDGHDPACYGVDALTILQGERPIFLTTNFGREALFSYLVAICSLVLGDVSTAIYATSAIIGVLTIPAVYLVAEEMFSTEQGALARSGGLLAALTMAVSYWHLNWSRLGMRAILVPLFAALIVYFLWRGLRTGSLWAYAGCGFFLGLSMYTYQAARILPLLVLFDFAYVLWSRKSFSRRDLLNLILVLAVALVVFAPLGYYFLTHPGSPSQRIEQALVVDPSQDLGTQARILFDQTAKTLLVFSQGDQDPRVTIPKRPVLNPFLLLVLLLGVGISLSRIRKPLYLSLLTWLAVMSVPAVLAQYGATTKRAIGATPAVAMLVAIGLLVPYDALHRWTARRPSSWSKVLNVALLIVVGAGFAYTGVVTYRDYFVIWAHNPNLFTHFEVGLSAIGEYIGELPPEEQIYLSPALPEHPSIVLHSNQRQDVKGYNGRVCLVLPTQVAHDTTYIVVPGDDKNSLDLLREYFPQGGIADEGPLHYQQPYFLAYRVPAGVEVQVEPSHRLEANWDDKMGLLGYDLGASTYEAGETVHLTLYYQGLSKMKKDYTVFTHLLGPYNPATDGPLWGQDDSEPCRRFYPTSSWDVGEIVIDEFTIPIPTEMPQGDYDLTVGFYQWPTLEHLPVLDTAGQVAADNGVILGQVCITGCE